MHVGLWKEGRTAKESLLSKPVVKEEGGFDHGKNSQLVCNLGQQICGRRVSCFLLRLACHCNRGAPCSPRSRTCLEVAETLRSHMSSTVGRQPWLPLRVGCSLAGTPRYVWQSRLWAETKETRREVIARTNCIRLSPMANE